MKSVLISIQPKWCELIASGKKTIEVRKTKPKLETPFKCYIYCTNQKGYAFFTDQVFKGEKGNYSIPHLGNSKVIGEFVCDKIYDITPHFDTSTFPNQYICDWDYGKDFDCLSFEELTSYLNGKQGYGWHISDLVIYDKPRELSEFAKPAKTAYDDEGYLLCDGCEFANWNIERVCTIDFCPERMITRPPQSWCYVESEEGK